MANSTLLKLKICRDCQLKKPGVYCGLPIERIGLDRVDNTQGYLISNIVSCCKQCNQMKMDYTRSEFIEHCVRIVKHTDRIKPC